ncbi:ornithine cyclodeaminase family protein [Ktedonospora formicarum]|uniref:Delta(1)-pyrroline-2-carboxylate reductase n=1 Tax=Ktedonospora formicarum TaxID=2778364 RepID=A0A8J3I6N0_9CHLR|nr:ornithine cyclodeaminase family protein [Ktedonospora formicarum]GHO48083.1 delta(1)-pyrroline-2-carboxylate reductase [Ktedonospora formicarum]
MTMLLTRTEIEPLLHLPSLLPPLRAAFASYSLERSVPALRVRSSLPGQETASAMLIFPGLVPTIPAYTVKVHAKYPGLQPALKGVLLLHDLENGSLLAIMDSTAITAVRTGLAGALAADVLARPGAESAAIIGAGVQGRLQLRCLTLVRSLKRAWVYDTIKRNTESFAADMEVELGIPVMIASSPEEAAREADIVVTSTWASQPFLFAGMVQPGTHITTLGPDEPGKVEVAADLLRSGLFVCDDRELALTMGAVGNVGLGRESIHAELGEIIAGQRVGRSSPEQITIFGGVGLAFQDLVACWHVYQAAQQHTHLSLDFLS